MSNGNLLDGADVGGTHPQTMSNPDESDNSQSATPPFHNERDVFLHMRNVITLSVLLFVIVEVLISYGTGLHLVSATPPTPGVAGGIGIVVVAMTTYGLAYLLVHGDPR